MMVRTRKTIPSSIKLKVFKRDNYSCKICGRSPVTNPGLSLHVDHILPFSKGGTDELSNFQTLCSDCNLGKGNNEELNKLLKNDIDILMNKINPLILNYLAQGQPVRVVANQEDFAELSNKNNDIFYSIKVIPNTIMGYGSGANLGLYTLNDSGGSKVNFLISNK